LRRLFLIIILLFTILNCGSVFSDGVSAGSFQPGNGFYMGVLFLDFGELNQIIQGWDLPSLEKSVPVFGGLGTGGDKLGSRFGGAGLGGRVESVIGDKETILEINYGGFVFEYGILATQRFNLALGGLLGGGMLALTLTEGDPGSFKDIWDGEDFNSLAITNAFVGFKPHLSIQFRFTDFLYFNFGLSYLFTYTFGDDWLTGNKKVVDGPLSNFRSPHIGLGISFCF